MLEFNDQPVGELIVKQHSQEQPIVESAVMSYVLAAVALIALIFLSVLLNVYINKRFMKSSELLSDELLAITENQNYHTHVNYICE